MDKDFRKGFEKNALWKELALSSTLALSPIAKAGGSAAKKRAVESVTRVAKHYAKPHIKKFERRVLKKVNKKIKKTFSTDKGTIELGTSLGDNFAKGQKSGLGKAVARQEKRKISPKVRLKNLSQLKIDYGNLSAKISPKMIKAKYNINKNTSLSAFARKGNKGVYLGWTKDF